MVIDMDFIDLRQKMYEIKESLVEKEEAALCEILGVKNCDEAEIVLRELQDKGIEVTVELEPMVIDIFDDGFNRKLVGEQTIWFKVETRK